MSTPNTEKDSLLGQTILAPEPSQIDFCHPVRADVLYREGMAVILFKKSTIGQQKLASLAQLLLHKDIKRLSEDFLEQKKNQVVGVVGSPTLQAWLDS